MFRQITNHKRTGAVGNFAGQWMVKVFCDDGWEEILDHHVNVASEAEGVAYLLECGFEEYDPNAALKAAGFVWDGGCYRKPREE